MNGLKEPSDASLHSGSVTHSNEFEAFFQRLPVPCYIWQRSGDDFELTAHNKAAAQVPLTRIGELLGARARNLYADRPDIRADLMRCAERGAVIASETDLRLVSGTKRHMVLTWIPLSKDLVVVHAEDITDRKPRQSTQN